MPTAQRKPTMPVQLDIEDAIRTVTTIASMRDGWTDHRCKGLHSRRTAYRVVPLDAPDLDRLVVWLNGPWPGKPLPQKAIVCLIRDGMHESDPNTDAGESVDAGDPEGSEPDAADDTEDRSVAAYRIGAELRADGKSFPEMCNALRANPKVADWVDQQDEEGDTWCNVELSRIWNAARSPATEHHHDSTKKTKKTEPAAEPAASLDPEPWPAPVDGAELLDALVAAFRRYLSLPEGAAEALALWVVFTHVIDASFVAPRLAILAPTYRCGKSTLIFLLIRLVRRPLPSSNATPASVFRVIARSKPTLLFDEADTFFNGKSDLVGIINSGHTRDTAYVMRAVAVDDTHEPATFGTYAAIAIAKIGRLPGPLQDRAIVIHMRRRRSDEQLSRFRADRVEHLLELRRKATRWAKDHLAELKEADPDIPEVLNDRAQDNWRMMIAIGDAAGGPWPQTARRVAVVISGDEKDTTPLSEQLIRDIKEIFIERAVDRLSAAELCQALGRREDGPWNKIEQGFTISPNRLASMLKGYGIRPKVMRSPGSPGTKPFRGYMRDSFVDAWARYTPDTTSEAAAPSADYANAVDGNDGIIHCGANDQDICRGGSDPGLDIEKPDQSNDVTLCYGDCYATSTEKPNEFNDVTSVTRVMPNWASALLTTRFHR